MKNYILSGFLFCVLFSSCSVSQKINRLAKEYILKDDALVNAHTGISIYEPATGKFWYNYQGEKYFVPASNMKLATCYAAMKYLGDSVIGIKYRIINDSTIEIKGNGDPTFLHPDFKNQPVYAFLKKFRSVKIIHSPFEDYLGNGWAWGDYLEYYMAQRSALPIYGNVVRIKWEHEHTLNVSPPFFKSNSPQADLPNGFQVEKPWDANEYSFLPGTQKSAEVPFRPDEKTLQELLRDTLGVPVEIINEDGNPIEHTMYSQPTDSVLKIMMHRSDNFFAEQSLLMVSNTLLGKMDDRKIIDTLLQTDFKSLPQPPSWADGSGLSRYDLFSPKDFVFILNKIKEDFGMERIKSILPTGGTGTIHSYYLRDSGYIFAKTGSLNGVLALSGFLYTRKNKLLIFSILVNNHHSSATSIRKAIEKMLQSVRSRN